MPKAGPGLVDSMQYQAEFFQLKVVEIQLQMG